MALDEGEISAEGGESVAQLVRYPTGKLAQAGKALGQASLLGLTTSLRQVREEHEVTAHRAVVAPQRMHRQTHRQLALSRVNRALLALDGAAFGNCRGEQENQLGLPRQSRGKRLGSCPGVTSRGTQQSCAHGVEREHLALPIEHEEATPQTSR